jgi:hypothetical protein
MEEEMNVVFWLFVMRNLEDLLYMVHFSRVCKETAAFNGV